MRLLKAPIRECQALRSRAAGASVPVAFRRSQTAATSPITPCYAKAEGICRISTAGSQRFHGTARSMASNSLWTKELMNSMGLDCSSYVPSLGIAVDRHDCSVDPFRVVAQDLEAMTISLRETVSVLQHPVLDRAASHLFSLHGKRLRPVIVVLMGRASSRLKELRGDSHLCANPANSLESLSSDEQSRFFRGRGLSVATVDGVYANEQTAGTGGPQALVRADFKVETDSLLDSQRRLAEITEMIHAASLLHDDVIDTADSRRGVPSVNSMFGNQVAVLAGDFLLARASVALSRLRNCDVVELLSTVIEHLVRGEIIQMKGGRGEKSKSSASQRVGCGGIGDVSEEAALKQRHYHAPRDAFESYMAKTFFKTASLMANSCRAVTMLADHSCEAADAAYSYGEHLGIAFQLVDDILDFTSNATTLGKPVLNDLRNGHATAPVLYALDKFPDELGPLIERRFRKNGDVDAAVDMVYRAGGIEQTRTLAAHHARTAVVSIADALPPSDARSALINLAEHVLMRSN